MTSRRTIILVAAIVVAALATYALLNYVQGVEDKAKPNPVPVYMISEEIKRGTPGSDVKSVSIKKAVIPAEFRPDTFVSDLTELDGKVAVIDLKPNQILVQGLFVQGERLNTTFKDKIVGDNVAVAMQFDTVKAVGGYVKPGDEVNLLLTLNIESDGAARSDTAAGGTTPASAAPTAAASATKKVEDARKSNLIYKKDVRYFYEKVRILAIGSEVLRSPGEAVAAKPGAATTPEGPGGGGTFVFLVPPDVAQRLLAVEAGSLVMTLPSETWKPVPILPLPIDAFDPAKPLPAEDVKPITPYGPTGFQDPSSVKNTTAPATTAPSTAGPTTTRG